MHEQEARHGGGDHGLGLEAADRPSGSALALGVVCAKVLALALAEVLAPRGVLQKPGRPQLLQLGLLDRQPLARLLVGAPVGFLAAGAAVERCATSAASLEAPFLRSSSEALAAHDLTVYWLDSHGGRWAVITGCHGLDSVAPLHQWPRDHACLAIQLGLALQPNEPH